MAPTTIELTVTATVGQGTVPNPFADGVFFFGEPKSRSRLFRN